MAHKQKDMEGEQQTGKGGKAGAIIGNIINVILIIAIILAFFCTYTAFVTKKGSGVPNLLGFEPFAIQTDSMSPFFEAGDLIIDKSVKDPSELEVGDVITFWTIIEGERVLNTHRIVEAVDAGTYTYYVTKGDHNSIEDSLTVHQSEVVGKYWKKISGLGSVLDFLQTSKGFFCTIVLPVAAFFLYYLVSFFKVLFEYQAAKNRQKFEEEQVEKTEQTDSINLTQEQLLELLAKAQSAPAETEKTENAEIKIEEVEKTEEKVQEKSETKISLSQEELEALIQNAVKKAKEEE